MKKIVFIAICTWLLFVNFVVADEMIFKINSKKSDNLLMQIYDHFSDKNLEKKANQFL